MAYKPRIESNNLDLTSILSTINELPDAGASVETCTVTISTSVANSGVDVFAVSCFDVENGFYTAIYDNSTTGGDAPTFPFIINNVICGTVMFLRCYGAVIPMYSCSSGITLQSVSSGIFVVTAPAGSSETITYIDID